MSDLGVSVTVLGAVVLLSELTRRTAARFPPSPAAGASWPGVYLLEAASTFQLCACSLELKLLGERAGLGLSVDLGLTYAMTLIHLSTFRGASCNPCGALERLWRRSSGAGPALFLIGCQFSGAVAARCFARWVWSLGVSDVHLRHRDFGYRCFDPLGGTVLEAAAVEMACAFTVQAAGMHVHKLEKRLRVHAIAAVVTGLVYAGGTISGAVFNPVLAFSIQFPCSGHTSLEYCLVYWLGPLMGVSSCVLLFDTVLPVFSGQRTVGVDVNSVHKHKTH